MLAAITKILRKLYAMTKTKLRSFKDLKMGQICVCVKRHTFLQIQSHLLAFPCDHLSKTPDTV